MKAAIYREYRGPITVETLPDPVPQPDGVVLRVASNGICRSDWHGWVGHDPDIVLPHVPGHEIAGVVEEVGKEVRRWKRGDRVSVPFIAGCGRCRQCRAGNQQVCDRQFQPGFHGWGGFAERVALRHADLTLAALPDAVGFVDAASLGCRFATSFRAVQAQGRVTGGDWVAVHGCGGVGLAAVMIAAALGARVVAVDIRDEALAMARSVGAVEAVNASESADPVQEIRDITDGGAHVSMDALGHTDTCFNSVACLRKRGRHVQVGLMTAEHRRAGIPWDLVIAWELEMVGSHGLQAHEYDRILRMVASGDVDPAKLVTRSVSLEEGVDLLTGMDDYNVLGVVVIDRFA
ncbi:MAG: zinc-dependent alcohol dehydrogenase family protein [Gemmatimonadota bacterium]|nr:zinc-dependent alcohol dehydrogenase family protein [Gemmatimonadota bacterium]